MELADEVGMVKCEHEATSHAQQQGEGKGADADSTFKFAEDLRLLQEASSCNKSMHPNIATIVCLSTRRCCAHDSLFGNMRRACALAAWSLLSV